MLAGTHYPYPTNFFCPENVACLFLSTVNILMQSRLDFFLEVNNMNPDQTAPW